MSLYGRQNMLAHTFQRVSSSESLTVRFINATGGQTGATATLVVDATRRSLAGMCTVAAYTIPVDAVGALALVNVNSIKVGLGANPADGTLITGTTDNNTYVAGQEFHLGEVYGIDEMQLLVQRIIAAVGSLGTAGTPSADVTSIQGIAGMTPIAAVGAQTTVTSSFTRPADTNIYAAGDSMSDSTTVPTAGGFTLTGMGRVSGGSGIILDIEVISSAPSSQSPMLQGEIFVFDAAVAAVNDNAAFVASDAEMATCIGKFPFTLEAADANNCIGEINNLNKGFTCVGSSNLRWMLKAKNAYTPVSGEVFTVRFKVVQGN